MDGHPEKGIPQGMVKLEKLLNNSEHDLSKDTDQQGNNILHLIAENGLFEFYMKVRDHRDFDKMKNQCNNLSMTPHDIISARPKLFKCIFSVVFQDPMTMIPAMVTSSYHNDAVPKLTDAMACDDIMLTRSNRENSKLYFSQLRNINEETWTIIDKMIGSFFDAEDKESKCKTLDDKTHTNITKSLFSKSSTKYFAFFAITITSLFCYNLM